MTSQEREPAGALRSLPLLALGLVLSQCGGGGGGFVARPEPSASQSSVTIDAAEAIPADGETPAVVVVTVRAASGAAIAAVPVTAEVSGFGHVVTPPTIESDSAGVARVRITSTRAETKTLRLRAGGAGGPVSLAGEWQLRFVPTAPSPSHCSAVAISGLYAATDGVAPAPIRVTVRDRFLNPIPDVTVELEASGDEHTLTQPTGPTNARGEAYGTLASRRVATKFVTARVRSAAATIVVDQRIELRFVDRPAISGTAAFADLDTDGVCAEGDTLLLPLAEAVNLRRPLPANDLVALGTANDTLGENAEALLVPTSDALLVRLGKHPRLRARGGFSPLQTTANAPSGIDLSPVLPNEVLVSSISGLSGAGRGFVDVFADLVRVPTAWPSARCLAVGDLDRDGDPDVVFAGADGSVFWSRNDGLRGFSSGILVTRAEEAPAALAVADLDADGRPDVVVSCVHTGVLFCAGEANATFALPQKLVAVGGPALAIADVNGDGRPDAVVGGSDGFCWIGSHDAPWAPLRAFNLGVVPRAVAVGDLDGDGDVDLVFDAGASLLLLANAGVAGLRVLATVPAPNTTAIACADFDLDGDLDLAVAGEHGTRVWWNVRPGAFVDAGLSLGQEAVTAILAADVDGDADCDLFTAGADGGLWLNTRPGFVRARSALAIATASVLAATDFDHDGDLDLASADGVGPAACWFGSLAAVRGDLELAPGIDVPLQERGACIRAADLDRDGDVDLVVAHSRGGTRVWLNDGTGVLSDSGQLLGAIDYTMTLVLGDVDGDGDIDIITGNTLDQAERLYLNDGNGRFTESPQAIGSGHTTALVLVDIDRDGDLDLVTGNLSLGAVGNRVFVNDGHGVFTDTGQMLGATDTRALAAGDLDGDGDDDLVIGAADGTVSFWLNDGHGRLTDTGRGLQTSRLGGIALGDVDGDGDLDLVVGTDATEADRVFVNDGHAVFVDSGERLGAQRTLGVELVDIDADGDLDVLTTSFAAPPGLQRNDGRGRFTALPITTAPAVALCTADLDRDGDVDIVLVGSDGRLRTVLSR